ncbi:hypothetical protein [Burkholderia ubonensis]|uniref:hypothetical protein n=1 Tax=Burkholderia ubonensis TaxID=101571 RepID=UPI000A7917CA|nr:hypothetical protein [Burkholderia ubonensis]
MPVRVARPHCCGRSADIRVVEGDRQGGGLRTLGYVRRNFPALPIVVFTVAENHAIYWETWRLDGAALVSKADSPGELLLAIRSAASVSAIAPR